MPIFNGTPGDDTLVGTNADDQMFGFGGNDGLIGGDGDDLLDGGDDHDFLRGQNGNDIMLGGNGDDFLNGGDGDDTVDGGAGIDRAAYSTGAIAGVTVDLNIVGVAQDTGSQGFDTLIGIEHLSGTRFDDVLKGDGGDNWLWGGSDGSGVTGNDIILAGAGNDLVQLGTGTHTADGDLGNDTLSLNGNGTDITSAGVTVSLALQGAAQDTEQGMMTLSGFENLSGSTFDDNLSGDGNDNILLGDIGNDSLSGGAGADTLYGDGRTGVDTHDTGGSGPIVTYADVSLLPGAGAPGADVLEGGDGDDTLDGGGGSDFAAYTTASGDVQVFLDLGFATGAAGDDTLVSIENFLGSAFNDFARGTTGDNVLAGNGGHDLLRGLAGNDTIKGGDGDDYLEGGPGDDILDGQDGLDRVAFRTAVTAGATVDLNIQGVAQATGHGMDTLIGIEHASGNMFADTLIGNAGDNWLWGEAGDDTISGNDGNDLVQVGAGTVTADGGAGNSDSLSFGGDELVSFITSNGVTVSLDLQGAAQATEQGSMTLDNFENLSGSNFDDNLTGDNNDNILAGDSGADTLVGGKGDDTLLGDGRITIDSHGAGTSGPIVTITDVGATFALPVGNDVLNGGKGNDVLNGGGGDDVLTGGQNRDIFAVGVSSGTDFVTDFQNNQDRIRFEGIAGVDDFSDLTIAAVGPDVHISWGTGDSIVLQGTAIGVIGASDFIFI